MARWNWIEDWLLTPAVAVLNSAWLGLWVLWLVRGAQAELASPPVSPVMLALLLVAAALITRRTLYGEQQALSPRFLLASLGVLAIFAATWLTFGFGSLPAYFRGIADWGSAISPVFINLFACAYMWWSGIRLGRSNVPHDTLERYFYGGSLALAMLFGVNHYRPLVSSGEALLAAMIFFATGLASLALVSLSESRRLEENELGHWPSLNRYWLGTVGSVIGIILLSGLVAASLLSPSTFEWINRAFQGLVTVVTLVFVFFLGTLVFIAAWLLQPLLQQLAKIIGQNPMQIFSPPQWQAVAAETATVFEQYPALNKIRQGLVLLAIAGGLGLLFWWAVRRFNRVSRLDTDETRESIATRDLVLDQLLQLFRRKPRPQPEPPPFLALAGPRDDPRLMVRRAYQAMLEWAQSLSLPPRRAGQTPQAYAETIAQSLPQGQPELTVLTRAYLTARYAADAPSLEEARSAQGAVQNLRSLSPAPARRTDRARRPGTLGAP